MGIRSGSGVSHWPFAGEIYKDRIYGRASMLGGGIEILSHRPGSYSGRGCSLTGWEESCQSVSNSCRLAASGGKTTVLDGKIGRQGSKLRILYSRRGGN